MGCRKILAGNGQAFIQGFVYLTRLSFTAAKLIRAVSISTSHCGAYTTVAQRDKNTNTGPPIPKTGAHQHQHTASTASSSRASAPPGWLPDKQFQNWVTHPGTCTYPSALLGTPSPLPSSSPQRIREKLCLEGGKSGKA